MINTVRNRLIANGSIGMHLQLTLTEKDKVRLWLFKVLGGRTARKKIGTLMIALNRVRERYNSGEKIYYVLLPEDMEMLRRALAEIDFMTLENVGVSQQEAEEIINRGRCAQAELGLTGSH